MAMVKKSISVTDQQDMWIKSQIKTGHFGNESEVVRELIRERQLREQETTSSIQAIRNKLIKAEKSGFTAKTSKQILADIKEELKLDA